MRERKEIGIFIASPSDTKKERELITKYINEYNSTYGDDEESNTFLRVIKWEEHLATRSNIKPQEAINEDLLEQADILTGIFWTKFGTPTDKAQSGTEEEIEYCLKNKKPVIMYFLNKKIDPNAINTEDFNKVKAFKNKYKEHNIYRETDLSDEDNFRTMFIKDIRRNVKLLINSITKPKSDKKIEKPTQWFEKSIKSLVEQNLENNGLQLPYRRKISFDENIKLWNSIVNVNHQEIKNKIYRAREDAFNTKYGNYNYKLDLRAYYQNSWHLLLKNLLEKENVFNNKKSKILGVASNVGEELSEIFNPLEDYDITVFDISVDAIKRGKSIYPSIKFHKENMEDTTFDKETFDVYINLRSIHSSGVDLRMTLAECYRLLKPNGTALISVSNGYLTENLGRKNDLVPTYGMYDNRIKAFSTDKPYELANKIRMKLDYYGFSLVEIHTGLAEIFIKAKK